MMAPFTCLGGHSAYTFSVKYQCNHDNHSVRTFWQWRMWYHISSRLIFRSIRGLREVSTLPSLPTFQSPVRLALGVGGSTLQSERVSTPEPTKCRYWNFLNATAWYCSLWKNARRYCMLCFSNRLCFSDLFCIIIDWSALQHVFLFIPTVGSLWDM